MVKSKQDQITLERQKLRTALDRLGSYIDFINELPDDPSDRQIEKLKLYQSRAPQLEEEYVRAYNELSVTETDLSEFMSRIEFQDKSADFVVDSKLILTKLSKQESKPVVNNSNNNSNQNTALERALPALQIPQFSGKISEYATFLANFKSIVDATEVDGIRKFMYLKLALKGDATECISTLTPSHENYQLALNLLDGRYNKPHLIIQSHINNIFDLPNVTKSSHVSIEHLIDGLNKNLDCLKNLNVVDNSLAAALIAHIIESKLDSDTKKKWKRFRINENFDETVPTVSNLLDFLRKHASFLADMNFEQITPTAKTYPSKPQNKFHKSHSLVTTETSSNKCPFCKGNHSPYACIQFQTLSVEKRIERVKELKLCENCLKHNQANTCYSKHFCYRCKKRHHTLLHLPNDGEVTATSNCLQAVNSDPPPNESTSSATNQPVSLACNSHTEKALVLLSTAIIILQDQYGRHHEVRCLLDSGSTNNLMTKDLAEKLGLRQKSINISLIGVNGKSTVASNEVEVSLYSRTTNYKQKVRSLVIEKITTPIPSISFEVDALNIPANLELADPTFNRSGEVEMLLGASHFYSILTNRKIPLKPEGLVLQDSKLGYLVTGYVYPFQSYKQTSNCLLLNNDINFDLQKFWEIENVPNPCPNLLLSKEERLCDEHFDRTIQRADDGKFTVTIPFNSHIQNLGSSYEMCLKRFLSLEARLERNETIKLSYHQFLQEYLALGHLSAVSFDQAESYNYLPHHEILKPTSTTTKLRVVFDGSAKTSTGISINDCQYTGPVVQRDLFSILLNFRKYRVAVTADCGKMYRQIRVTPEQRKFQCILWRDSPEKDIGSFQLNTITYGLTSSSFLATKCLQQLARENLSIYPEAAQRILRDFYMDDFISGAENYGDAVKIVQEVTQILNSAGFPLRKFLSNNVNLSERKSNSSAVLEFKDTCSKALGIQWHPESDTLRFQFSGSLAENVTKRQLLSTLSKLFDPLGLIAPLIVTGKLLLQEVWSLQLNWDSKLPDSLCLKWKDFFNDLSEMPEIKLPRHAIFLGAISVELHGFCDASVRAYGACIYSRCVYRDRVEIHLLCAKSRVAPLKPVTLPRLELLAAVLLTELAQKVLSIFPDIFRKSFYWSDSQIVLSWIKATPNQFATFVANRIALIQEATDVNNWHYCRTTNNPADLVSRGCNMNRLLEQNFWYQGPDYLKSLDIVPTAFQNVITVESLPEVKRNRTVLVVTDKEINCIELLCNKFSTYSKLLRVLSYVLRFINSVRTIPEKRERGSLTVKELDAATTVLISSIQSRIFSKEISALNTDKSIAKCSHLQSLSPFVDNKGILRVGGRLRHSNFSYENIHPIVLPKRHRLTNLIISHYHITSLHCGANQLLARIREKFWPLSGRSLCRKFVRQCVVCFKSKPTHAKNIMGDLPASRFTSGFPCFTNTGVDFAGPFLIKDRTTRNPKLIKIYVCLFVCMTSKAVHLDLVTNLTAEAFLAAFRRFISRRGKPQKMFSDNATNFVSAANEIKRLYKEFEQLNVQKNVCEYLTNEGIEWNFIPPGSPHFGGIWESNIKSMKTHLYKILKDTRVTYEHLYTVLTEIEAVLNSRPLCPLSSDPNDYSTLTPLHFLIGKTEAQLPLEDTNGIKENRLSQYQYRQRLVQHFWRRWSREVLPELQSRLKWKVPEEQIKLGALVLLEDNHTRSHQWPLGRVVEVHPGADGRVRVVTIKLSNGHLVKRAIVKVCPLPNQ